MSDVDTLRKAAALMRERAQAATPGSWMFYQHSDQRTGDGYAIAGNSTMKANGRRQAEFIAKVYGFGPMEADAWHIVSWPPPVALAAANWLDATAETTGCDCGVPEDALTFARAYLGDAS